VGEGGKIVHGCDEGRKPLIDTENPSFQW